MYMNMLRLVFWYSPQYIAWLVGLCIALARWRRHPRVSLLAASAFGLMFVASLVGNYVSMTLPTMLMSRGIQPGQFGPWFLANSMGQSLIGAVTIGLLIAATFGGRRSEQ